MHKRWEFYLFLLFTLLTGAIDQGLVPQGVWLKLAHLAQETVTASLTFLGIRLVNGRVEPAKPNGDA